MEDCSFHGKVEFESSLKDKELLAEIVGVFLLGSIVYQRICVT